MFDRSAVLGPAPAVKVALGDRRFAKLSGNDYLVSPTALKDPAAPLDLVVTDRRTGRQIRYQMKLSDKASINAPDDARYAGGRILVPQDTLESVRAALVLGLR